MRVEDQPIEAAQRGGCERNELGLRRRVATYLCAAPLAALTMLAGGFLWFALHVANEAPPLDRAAADGIVALTGGASRISDAVELLASGRGQRLLITGVAPTTNTAELIRLAPGSARWFGCCIDLDYSAVNTVGNAAETGRWARERGFRSLVVVTSGYHMPRALMEIAHRLPDVTLIPFPVVSPQSRAEPWWSNAGTAKVLVFEYLKFIVAAARIGLEPASAATETAPRSRARI
ncbi:MAG TPA: YdcF family protein [Xanthobacteraceae bacterium]|jgi:uncharacterized SAM-binding protein YcdF (DUF218 family)|nr:YdcF family protein [Xanthobacteraceae bacterium]